MTQFHQLRKAQEIDIAFIAECEQQVENRFVHSNSVKDHTAALRGNPDIIYLIAEDTARQTLGYALLHRDSPEKIEFRRIVVISKEKGVGTAFIRAICNYFFQEPECNAIWLDVYEQNARARHVYNKIGFKETGLAEGSAHPEFGHLVIMELRRPV